VKSDMVLGVRAIESLDECARCTRTASFEVLVPWDIFQRTGMGTIAAEQIEYMGSSWARFVVCSLCHETLIKLPSCRDLVSN